MPNTDTEKVGFNFSLTPPSRDALSDGYNQYGVRENYDDNEELESIDVIFEAMEPGIRKGVEITPGFLQWVADNSEVGSPAMLDHSKAQLSKVGNVTEHKYSDDFLRLKVNIPNTGSSVKSDIISDFTHEPPDITDGSIGFERDTVEFSEPESDEAHARFDKALIKEFSFTPFPAGYDNGGLSPQFSEMVDEFSTGENEVESQLTGSQLRPAESQLTTK